MFHTIFIYFFESNIHILSIIFLHMMLTKVNMMSLKSVDITKKSKTIKPLLEHVRTKSHCYDKLFMTGVAEY